MRYVDDRWYSNQILILIGYGTHWASYVRVSSHVRDDCDERMAVEKNGLILLFITEASWTRKNGHAQ